MLACARMCMHVNICAVAMIWGTWKYIGISYTIKVEV